ncbi:MAG TPA: glycoside hydrolase family 16 protein [Anaerolineales bacterium]|nr:glycoside hydrolase family 16 protein [Anaerolineales bacterium]
MKRIVMLTLVALMVLTACGTAAPKLDRPGWTLVWHDEFDGKTIDPANWTYDIGGNGWGNVEMEYYTNRPENARIENGMLIIEARSEQYQGLPYTSARLKSVGLREFQYGRIEARMKLPYGQGIWPAFWMLGAGKSWPLGGEIDIMEYIGKTPDTIYTTVHGPGYSGAKGIGAHTVLTADKLKNDFHVFAVEWQPNDIRWFVDDQQVFEVTPSQIPAGTQWVYDHPFYILLNLAVGGGWPGFPDSTTVFPQQLQVDYVRVYQKPDQITPTP